MAFKTRKYIIMNFRVKLRNTAYLFSERNGVEKEDITNPKLLSLATGTVFSNNKFSKENKYAVFCYSKFIGREIKGLI